MSSPSASSSVARSRDMADELALDGVRYAELQQSGETWRIGSLDPLWRQSLLTLGVQPDAQALAALEEQHIWMAPANREGAAPLAVMCCGLGSVWPGMGRELYDSFPAARAAMDRLAALAEWDLLALMDETDQEKISLTRWQIPYLFLLEYAQWSQLVSLGLSPALLCGHSLGELIALCLAGVYDLDVAWYILDTRAIHMAELEEQATRDTGMMAVHAEAEVIARARETWPSLYVSNYNTPRQHILSGPREILLEARKSLRKQRIPAIMLNVSLAFHHPSMRILRDMSLRRLNGLEMHPPRVPMLSDITTEPYPQTQDAICRLIADLDENSVRWVECVQAMRQKHGIRHFLELGPQDTLCGLVSDIEPAAFCLTAGRKGHETAIMRQTCARLHALGHLSASAIRQQLQERSQQHMPPVRPRPAQAVTEDTPATQSISPELMQSVMDILARACGRSWQELRPDMDLRYDLSLRSSRFPLLIQEAETTLGIHVDFEDLLQVSTVGDLARAMSRATHKMAEQPASTATPEPEKTEDAPALCQPETPVQQVPLLQADPEKFPLVFPDPKPSLPYATTLFQGCCHFSHYADATLAAHGNPPVLPMSRALQALLEGARLLLPGMEVNGLSDVRLAAPLPLPRGVTRECRLHAQARLRLRLDGVMSRMCYTWLYSRDITANGRRMPHYSPLAEGMILLADGPAPLTPLWQNLPEGRGQPLPSENLAAFFAQHALAAPWQLLEYWEELPGNIYRASLSDAGSPPLIAPVEGIAPSALWRYNEYLRMLEAIVQTAQLALVWGEAPSHFPWGLKAAGYIRFGEVPSTAAQILLRRVWDDGRLRRFEAQVCNGQGLPLLTVHQLEFEKQEVGRDAAPVT